MDSANIYAGIILGAAAGGAVALLDKTTRKKTIRQFKNLGGSVQRYKSNPSEAVKDFRISYEKIAGDLSQKTEDALDLLTKVQESIEMIDNLTGRGSQGSTDDNSSSDLNNR